MPEGTGALLAYPGRVCSGLDAVLALWMGPGGCEGMWPPFNTLPKYYIHLLRRLPRFPRVVFSTLVHRARVVFETRTALDSCQESARGLFEERAGERASAGWDGAAGQGRASA